MNETLETIKNWSLTAPTIASWTIDRKREEEEKEKKKREKIIFSIGNRHFPKQS